MIITKSMVLVSIFAIQEVTEMKGRSMLCRTDNYILFESSLGKISEFLDCARHAFQIGDYTKLINHLQTLRFELGLRGRGSNQNRPSKVETLANDHELMQRYDELVTCIEEKVLSNCEDISVEDRCEFISWSVYRTENSVTQSDYWNQLLINLDIVKLGELLKNSDDFNRGLLDHQKLELIERFISNSSLSEEGYVWALDKIVSGAFSGRELHEIGFLNEEVMEMMSFCTYIHHFKNDSLTTRNMMKWLKFIDIKYYNYVEILLDSKRDDDSYLDDPNVNKKIYKWCFNQPILVQDFVITQLFSTHQSNIGLIFELFDYEYIEFPKNSSPLVKSLCWLYSILDNLSKDSNEGKGVYYYQNSIGVITKSGLWEIEVSKDTWLFKSPMVKVNFSTPRGIRKDICIHHDERHEEKLPLGDEIISRVLACWNDELVSAKVSTFDEVLNRSEKVSE